MTALVLDLAIAPPQDIVVLKQYWHELSDAKVKMQAPNLGIVRTPKANACFYNNILPNFFFIIILFAWRNNRS